MDDKALKTWASSRRYEISSAESKDLVCQRLSQAKQSGIPVKITYYGGSSPGSTREISPRKFFYVDGYDGLYIEAFCHLRNESRTFRVDRIQVVEWNREGKDRPYRRLPPERVGWLKRLVDIVKCAIWILLILLFLFFLVKK